MEKLALTIRELSEAGGGSRTTIYQALNSGKLKAKKRGRSTIILTPDAVRYLESLPTFPGQEAA